MRALANLVLRSAQPRDHAVALDVLTDAATGNPVHHWAEPDPARRPQQIRLRMATLLEHAAVHGTIRIAETAGTPAGVAVWFPYPLDPAATDVHDLTLNDHHGLRFTDAVIRLGRLGQALKARHPTVAPHHYLAGIGVLTGEQNHGIGTALIADPHTGLNHHHTPAYVEADNWRSRNLYRRLGYTDLGEPVTVDGSPPVQPMWLIPRPATT